MRKIITSYVSLLVMFAALFSFTTVALAAPTSGGGGGGGTGNTNTASGSGTDCTTLGVGIGNTNKVCGNGNTQLENYIAALVTWANGVITILAVLMIMYGGIKYVYSMGSPDQIKDAKSTIIGAIAGVVLLMVADILLLAINPTLLGPVKAVFGK
jgi:hypothetical protein